MSIFAQVKEKLTGYIDVQVKLLKLSVIERTSNLLSYVIFYIALMFIFFCIILFLGFGLTELFVLMGLTKAVSFFITLGIYLLMLVIALALKKPITRYFASEIVNVITEAEEEADDEE